MADHWDFLEEFEAPMWADLNLEAKVYDLDTDDDWFNTSHHFHQRSSRQLKSTFFHPAKGHKAADCNFQKASSPEVPSSVSRSRGKDYRSRKWRETFMLGNRHPVNDLSVKTSCVMSGSSEVTTLKSSITSSKGSSTGKTRLVDQADSSSRGKENEYKPISTHGYSGSSSCIVDNMVEGNNSRVVTSDSIQLEQSEKVKINNHGFGTTSELLMVMRATLRKSFTTRQATRVEVKDMGRQKDSKSLSGKSSVGSSSNPRSYGRTSTAGSIQRKEATPDSRHISRMTQAARNKIKVQTDKRDFNSKGSKHIGKKSINLEVTKSKAQNEKLRGRVPLGVKVSEQKSVIATTKQREKLGASKLKGVGDAGTENVRGKMVVSQKCSGRVISAGTTTTFKRLSKPKLIQRSDKTACPEGKIREVSRGKNLLNQRLYFR